MKHLLIALSTLAVAVVAPADAQILEPPTRPLGGLFGGDSPNNAARKRQELFAQFNVMGGYDDNLTIPGSGASLFQPRDAGYTGVAQARMRYRMAKMTKAFEANGRAFMNTYRNAGLQPVYGGEGSAAESLPLGRHTTFDGGQSLRYDPSYYLGAFASLGAQLASASPDVNSVNALGVNPSWSTNATARVTQAWDRSTSSDVSYNYNQRKYVNGPSFDSRTHLLSTGLSRTLGRTSTVRGSYAYSDSLYERSVGGAIPTTDQTLDIGLSYSRDLSRTRRFSVSGGGGSTHVDTLDPGTLIPLVYWTPSGYGTLRYDFGRSWNVSTDYRRSVSVLQGLNPEHFITDSLTVQSGGNFSRDVQLVAVFGYANGFAGAGAGGEYDGYTGTAQMQFQLTRWWAAIVSVNHYEYRLNQAASVALGVTPDMHQNAIRVGLTWTLPLVGTIGTVPPIQTPVN